MINNVVLVGRAGSDPEIKHFENGTKVAELTLCVSRKYKEKEETSFIKVKFWDKAAEIAAEYIRKGHLFGVLGELRQERWEKNGEKRSHLIVIGSVLKLMQPKSSESSESKPEDDDNAPWG